jgi:hypothetical protein
VLDKGLGAVLGLKGGLVLERYEIYRVGEAVGETKD